MTTITSKMRSIVLVTLVLGSVLAAAGPLAGTAAATRTAGNSALLTDGPNWYGQGFAIDVSQNTGSQFSASSGDIVYLLENDSNGDTRIVLQKQVNSSDYFVFDTGNFETDGPQDYALNDDPALDGDEIPFTLRQQQLNLEWEDDQTATDSESVALEVVEGQNNRLSGEYNVTVSAEGFTYEQLRALFIHPGTDLKEVTAPAHLPVERLGFDPEDGDGIEELRSAGYITLNLSTSTNFTNDGEIVANFTNLEATETLPEDGEYEFDIVVTDSTAEDTAAVRIGGVRAEFEEPLYTRAAGDVAAFTVALNSTEQTWVQLRDTESNFVDVLYLEDDDGDGEVTFYANTRLMGTDHSQLSGVSAGDAGVVYYADGDTVQSHIHHETIPSGSGTEVSNAQFYDGEVVNSTNQVSFSQYVQRLNGNGPTDQLVRPLQPTTYELAVDRRGRFIIEDGEAAVDRQLGETELDLVQPSLRDYDTYVAPKAPADSQRSVDRLEANLSARETAAIGDQMILRFNTTGILGALATIDYKRNGNSIDTGLKQGYGSDVFYELAVNDAGTDWEGEGVNLTLYGEDRPNTARERLSLDNGGDRDSYVLVTQQTAEGDPGNVYLVIDTGSDAYSDSITDGKEYDTTLKYVANAGRFEFSGRGPRGGAGGDVTDPSFPYYGSEFRRNVSEQEQIDFEVVDLRFDGVDDGTVNLEAGQNATVAGETNLAPGTNLTVTVRLAPPSSAVPDEDPSFLARDTVVVADDGTFEGQFDLSSRTVGEQATVRVEREETRIATSDAEFIGLDALRGPFFETSIEAPAFAQSDETVNVTGTVSNTGETAGTAEVAIRVDGVEAVRGILDLDPGESRRIGHSVRMRQSDIDVAITSRDSKRRATIAYEAASPTPTPTLAPTPTLTEPATATPDEAAANPPPETPASDSDGGGFPWAFVSVGGGVVLAGASILLLRWLL